MQYKSKKLKFRYEIKISGKKIYFARILNLTFIEMEFFNIVESNTKEQY